MFVCRHQELGFERGDILETVVELEMRRLKSENGLVERERQGFERDATRL